MFKLSIVTAGVSAGLVVAAPLAMAGEAPAHQDHDGKASSSCDFTGGTGGGSSSGDASGDIAGITGATVGGVGGNNIGNAADCSDFLNHNVNGNQVLSDNDVTL